MVNKLGPTYIERGIEIGEARGEVRGEARGELKHARAILLRQGRRKLGEPSADMLTAIEKLTDANQIDDLIDRTLDVSSWNELFANLLSTPPSP